MKRLSLLLLLACLFVNTNVFACSCAQVADNFCESIVYNEHVALVKVVSHQGQFMDVEILQSIRHGFTIDTVTVIGQDGLNCSEWLDQFSVGDTLILGLGDFLLEDTFNLSVCGIFFLTYHAGMVSGAIAPDLASQSYSEFLSEFDQCASTSIESLPTTNEIVVEQHESTFTLISSTEVIKKVQVFDSLGKLVMDRQNISQTSVSFDLKGIKSGVFLFVVETESNSAVVKRFVN